MVIHETQIWYGVFYCFVCVFFFFFPVLGLCHTWAFSSCSEQGLHLVYMYWFLIQVAPLVVERRLSGTQASLTAACGLRSCGPRAQFLCGMWDLPRPGVEPGSPELAGRVLSTVPPGKSLLCVLMLTDVLDPEDIGHILEMAELWITYSFVNFLEYSCHPSA